MNKLPCLLIFFLLTSLTNSQDQKNFKTVNEAYDAYFKKTRESLYLHTNKSSFLRGENLWFQGYAYDRQVNNLNLETRNVEFGVYDSEGKLIQKKLYLVINGLFDGHVKIDSTFTDGEYYLKAETHWMKNFNEDYTHIQKFEVLGKKDLNSKRNLEGLDLKVLPESGYSLINTKGALAVKLINEQGLGVRFTASLLENDKPIMNFKSNNFGHAKVDFTPKPNTEYKVKATTPDGNFVLETVNEIRTYGYAMRVENVLSDRTIIYVNSRLPANSEATDKVKLLIHQEGKKIEIPYDIVDSGQVAKSIGKDQLFYGVNTLTLFVNEKPVSERLIFNRYKSINNPQHITLESIEQVTKDSLRIKLSNKSNASNANLSISALPDKSISYVKNQNIVSAFLLDPFVNGYVENKAYYFNSPNREVDYNLDLLLLTQGWSIYRWNNILQNKPELNFERKNGLKQTVQLLNRIPKRADKLLIYPTINKPEVVFDIDEKTKFELTNRYPIIGENVKISYVSSKRKFFKPETFLKTLFWHDLDFIDKNNLSPSISFLRSNVVELDEDKLYSNFIVDEVLDEVIIKSKKEDVFLEGVQNTTIDVDEDISTKFPYLSDLLRFKGYLVVDNNNTFSINLQSPISVSASSQPAVIFNGIFLTDLSILYKQRTLDFEEIYINKYDYSLGNRGAAGVIRLESRSTPLYDNNDSELPFQVHKIEKGFEPKKEFYTPEYNFYNTSTFNQTGVIGWFSNLTFDENGTLNLDIKDVGHKSLKLYIEGIAEDGSLINIQKDIEIK